MRPPSVVRLLAAALPAITLVAACGSSGPTALKTSDDVVSGLAEAGIPCVASGGQPRIDSSGTENGITFVSCDTFGVMLILDRSLYAGLETCKGSELLNWDQLDKQRVVVGPNFVIAPSAEGDALPEFSPEAQPAAFVDAFGGKEMSVSQWMTEEGCLRPTT